MTDHCRGGPDAEYGLFCVFDGHNGAGAAQFAVNEIAKVSILSTDPVQPELAEEAPAHVLLQQPPAPSHISIVVEIPHMVCCILSTMLWHA